MNAVISGQLSAVSERECLLRARGLDFFQHAVVYLAGQFEPHGTREAVQANVDARVLLINACNELYRDGMRAMGAVIR